MLFQLEGRADLHVSTRYEARLNCENSRGTLRCMSALERNPEVLASTQMRTLDPAPMERNPKKPLATRKETGLSSGHMSGSLRSPL